MKITIDKGFDKPIYGKGAPNPVQRLSSQMKEADKIADLDLKDEADR